MIEEPDPDLVREMNDERAIMDRIVREHLRSAHGLLRDLGPEYEAAHDLVGDTLDLVGRIIEGPPIVTIPVRTHAPDKWRFQDTETGQVWRWEDGRFVVDDEMAILHLRTCMECGQEILPKYIHLTPTDHQPTVGPIRR